MFIGGSRLPSNIINLGDSEEGMNLCPGVTASRIKSGLMNLDPLRSSNRRPGQVPPFAVFSQEKRGKLQELHPEYNFGELGRRLSEMWHALSEEEKELYRKKARMIGAQKLKAWDEKMKRNQPYFIQQKPNAPPLAASSPASSSSGTIKRRRTHGYAIFMSEERKKHSTVNVPLGDVTRKVAEAWRSLDPPVRATYEAKANRINAIENRRYQQALLQQQRTSKGGASSTSSTSSSPRTPLRITSVESLSSPRLPVKPNVNLPSGITISRVEPEEKGPKTSSSAPRMMPRATPKGLIDMRLNNGDSNGGGLIDMRGGGVRPKMMPLGGRVSHYPPPLQRRPMMNGSMMPMSYALPGSAGMPMKRAPPNNVLPQPMAKRAKHIIPPRPPLMRQGIKPASAPPIPSSIGILGTLDTWDKMCRLCGRTLIPIVPIRDDIQILEKIRDYLGMNLDLVDDKERGYPPGICRKCSGMLNGFDRFKKVVRQGQGHLDELAKMKREKMGLERKSTEMVNYEEGSESILPDLDIEIEDNVPRPMLPRPKNSRDSDPTEENQKSSRFSQKSGDEEDEGSMSSRSSIMESNGKEMMEGGESVVENDDEDDDLDPDFDPLNFLQVSDVVGDYEESSPNGKDEEESKEEEEVNSEKSPDDIQIANAIYESLMDQSAEESNGDEAKESRKTTPFPTPVHLPEGGDDNANDCDGQKEEEEEEVNGANSKNGEESKSDENHEFTNGNESDDSKAAPRSRSLEDEEKDRSSFEDDTFSNAGEDKSPDLSGDEGAKSGDGTQVQSMIDEEEKYIENEMEEEVTNGSSPPTHYEGPEEDEEEDPFPEPPTHVNFEDDFIHHDDGGQPQPDYQEDDPL